MHKMIFQKFKFLSSRFEQIPLTCPLAKLKFAESGWMAGLRRLILEGGERLALPIGDDGLPDPHLAHYTLSRLRNSGNKAATNEKALQSLLVFRFWTNRRSIDIAERARTFKFLTSGEILDLKDFLRHPVQYLRRSDSETVVKLQSKRLVDPRTSRNRFDVVMRYMIWLGEEYLGRLGDAEANRYLVAKDRLTRFASLLEASSDFGEASENSKPRWGLLPEQRDILLEVIRPGHPNNPFQVGSQHRNYALILLYYEFGLRLAEPLTLRLVGTSQKLSSVDLVGSYSRERGQPGNAPAIWLVQNHDDPDDPRVDQPVLKTEGRLLIFSETSIALGALVEWVNKYRNDDECFPGGKRSPFLFISRKYFENAKGRKIASPLSKKQITKIFKSLQQSFPVLKDVTSHVLRHDWNDRWNEMLYERGERWEDHKQEQCYAMGWVPNSTMPNRYGRRSIQMQSNKKIMALQERTRNTQPSKKDDLGDLIDDYIRY